MQAEFNWLLLLSYDGTCYHGWQVQPTQTTIEGTLEAALLKLTGKQIKVHGAGRTDAGVHALNHTACFSCVSVFSPEKWRDALNAVLPDDLVVKCVQKVPQDFHARHSAIGKRYRYQVFNLPYKNPFAEKKSWWVPRRLELGAIREAAAELTGTHDFSAFRASGCTSPNPVKELREISIDEKRRLHATLCFELEANSFLQHMVRILAGTLVETGLGKIRPGSVKTILESRARNNAGQTAPAHGLYVLQVRYPEGLVCWPDEVIDR